MVSVKRFSIEELFAWAQSFAAREWRLLLPVTLAFLALPPLIMDLLVPQPIWDALTLAVQRQNPQAAAAALQFVMPFMAVVLVTATFGGLTITAMALIPGISVREALTLALRRLLTMLGAVLLVAAAQLMAMMLVGVVFGLAHLGGAAGEALLGGIVLGVCLFVAIRLITLGPMVVTRRAGAISAIRESWLLSHGVFWRILGAMLIYTIGSLVVMIALNTAVGALITLSAKAAGAADLGSVLVAVFQRGVGSLLALGLHLLIAGVFRQLNNAPIRGI